MVCSLSGSATQLVLPACEAMAMQVLALVMCGKPALLAAQVINTDNY